jgi:hypothetical protein
MGSTGQAELAARAREFHHEVQAAVCDVFEPWRHGTVVRATRFPDYFDFNVVRVEEDPGMSAEALAAFADLALDGLRHGAWISRIPMPPRRYGPASRLWAG